MFDPKKHKGDGGNGNYIDAAGEYIIVITSLKREVNKNGKPMLSGKHTCVHGGAKGKKFSERYYLNEEALWKIGRLCEAVGHEEAFDLENDAEVWAAIGAKPFKVKIKIRKVGSKAYADIENFLFQWTSAERASATQWVADAEASGDLEKYGFEQSDEEAFSDNDPPADSFDDDDIPF